MGGFSMGEPHPAGSAMTETLPSRTAEPGSAWEAGSVPVAIVMITLNEAHNMQAVLDNLRGFAAEIFLVDSYSSDGTVDIALAHGVHVVQRRFRGFGDQWNFAVRDLPITSPWTMKLDPDERLSDELKESIASIIRLDKAGAFSVSRRLWFMGRPLPVIQKVLRGWKTGTCRFSDVLVNEHPQVETSPVLAEGNLEHFDSPDLHHWVEKQNRYSTAEALTLYRKGAPAFHFRMLANAEARKAWFKSSLLMSPIILPLVFFYCFFWQKAWLAGHAGYAWACLRCHVYRMRRLKFLEMKWKGAETPLPPVMAGKPDARVMQET